MPVSAINKSATSQKSAIAESRVTNAEIAMSRRNCFYNGEASRLARRQGGVIHLENTGVARSIMHEAN